MEIELRKIKISFLFDSIAREYNGYMKKPAIKELKRKSFRNFMGK
ncbi:MAG: hypothetical protein QME57_00070 [Patescibacteria group bacterium]|nr:hypothetical protein [Patescibacteria group bacterium]